MNAIASTLDPRDAVPRPVNTNRGCLLLNASFEPLAVLPLKRAVRLLLDERAETVEVDGTRVIRSAADRLPCPAVIRLVRFVHVPRRLRRFRRLPWAFHPFAPFRRWRAFRISIWRNTLASCGSTLTSATIVAFSNPDFKRPMG